MHKWVKPFALGVLVAALAASALAVVPVAQNRAYEIPIPEFDTVGQRTFAGEQASRMVEQTLSQRYGGQWDVQAWNGQARTPHWVYGKSVKVAGDLRDAATVEQIARQVVSANADVLRADVNDLVVTATPHALGKWAVHFQQQWHGLPVWEAKVRTVFSDDGKLMLMGSDYYQDIELDPQPSLSADAAIAVAKQGLPFDPLVDSIEAAPELMVLPVPQSGDLVEFHLVWRVRVRTHDPLGAWVTHVDAHDGQVIWRYNDIHFDYEGGTTSTVRPRTNCNPDEQLPMPYVDVTVTGVGTATTDDAGNWSLAGTGGDRSVSAFLRGPWINIQNYNGVEGQYTGTVQENVPLDIDFNDTNSRADERYTFDAFGRLHDLFLAIDPTFSYINELKNDYVNRTDGYCPGNAWWDPVDDSTNLCAAGGQYANTGEIQQVVEHEFGHGVQNRVLGGTQGGQGLGEGNGDILGNLITQDHVIGLGFYVGNCVSGIRDSQNNLQYPGDVVGQEIHYAGQVIAGFNWDAMQLLQAQYGMEQGTLMSAARWHFGRVLMQPTTQPDQVLATFLADDDNGDLSDGTPNHAIFCEAATNHGFECPEILVGVFVYHDGIPYQTGDFGSYDVACTSASLGGGTVVPSTVTLHYRVDGGAFMDMPMTDEGGGASDAMIPAQSRGSVVEYYISAINDIGGEGTSPRNAPDELHYFQVNDNFPDDMEVQTAWSVGDAGDDASTGIWERGDPEPTYSSGGAPVQPGDDHTPAPGVDCWVTGAAAGSGVGADDVDGGHTTLFSPKFDLTGGSNISISYWRWYCNNGGNAPNEDYWTVQISNDGGANWTDVENTNVTNTTWQQVTLDLSTYFPVAGVVQLRFVADDSGSGSIVEAAVDDFLLVGTFEQSTPVEDAPQLQLRFDLAQNHPNPFNPRTTVSFALDRRGPASLKVFDAAGRLVKVLLHDNLEAGAHSVVWAGDDDAGRPVASGVYFYRLEANGRTLGKRMLLVK